MHFLGHFTSLSKDMSWVTLFHSTRFRYKKHPYFAIRSVVGTVYSLFMEIIICTQRDCRELDIQILKTTTSQIFMKALWYQLFYFQSLASKGCYCELHFSCPRRLTALFVIIKMTGSQCISKKFTLGLNYELFGARSM